ncbi:uncharacterized protein LOC112018246 [Quercus suber]|uniref:uncharacterized protein LOC112018246 n=1 Tax=Quercus suber TaxID=58331 RepID=UPI000CE18E3C|nr:uncharacterized protein LOC112018246 [Quercus suber]
MRVWCRGSDNLSVRIEANNLFDNLSDSFTHSHTLDIMIDLESNQVCENVITSSVCSNSLFTSLVDDCKQLAGYITRIRFNHYYHEGNRSADKLARLGAIQDRPFSIFLSPPMDVESVFRADRIGVAFSRECPESLFSV